MDTSYTPFDVYWNLQCTWTYWRQYTCVQRLASWKSI